MEAECTTSSSVGVRLSDTGLVIIRNAEFDDLSLIGGTGLGWFSSTRYAEKIRGPVITTPALAGYVPSQYGCAMAEDAETAFWELHRQLLYEGFFGNHLNEIGEQVWIHETAVVGKDGFEVHDGKLIPHGGYVRLGDFVTIGANTCVDRSLWKEPTFIGERTNVDNLVHIAHNVQIGKRCRIVAGTVIGGSTIIGDDVFVGIGAHIRPGVTIGDGAFIGMSVTVLKDVAPGERITIG